MARITIDKPERYRPMSTGVAPMAQIGNVADSSGYQALAEAGLKITEDAWNKRQDTINTDYVANALVKAQVEVDALKERMAKEMKDPVGFSKKFSEEANKIFDTYAVNAPSEEARRYLKNNFEGKKANEFKGAFDLENKYIADNALSNSIENGKLLSNSLLDNPNSYSTKVNELELSLQSTKDVLDPSTQRKLEDTLRRDLVDARIRGLMSKDIRGAEAFVKGDEIKGILNADEIDKYRRGVAAEKDRLNNEALLRATKIKEELVMDRNLKIFEGTLTQLDLDDDLQKGVYGKKEYLDLSYKLESRLKKDDGDAKAIASVTLRTSQGLPFDTTEDKVRDQLDTYFNKVVVPTMTNENADTKLKSFVDQYNYIPSEIKSNLVAGLVNGDIDSKVSSAKQIASLAKEDPTFIPQFGNDVVLKADYIDSQIKLGIPKEQIMKGLDTMLVEKNTTAYKEREEVFRSEASDFNTGRLTSWFRNDPNEVPQKMVDEFNSVYSNTAINNKVDMDMAKEFAYKTIKSQWGISKATGEPKYMKYAPEIYYNKKGYNADWIETQLNEDIKSIAPEIESYDLEVFEPSLATGKPQYVINYINENGLTLELRDNSGRPLRWVPDISRAKDLKRK